MGDYFAATTASAPSWSRAKRGDPAALKCVAAALLTRMDSF
jgi:hypothetical protein